MRQKGTVTDVFEDTGVARVRVLRSAMCDGCENRADGKSCACSLMVSKAKEMTVDAVNPLFASPSDEVEIETESGTVLSYAAVVFLLPILGAALFYFLGERLFPASDFSWAFALVGFVLSFLPAVFVDRVNRKRTPRIRIVSLLNRADTPNGEDEGR